jgi:hypothetical protein
MSPERVYPSTQSFYKREGLKLSETALSGPLEPTPQGDGFTEEELANVLDPLNRKWKPEREYEESDIGDLVPGPKAVSFAGRIVNVSTIRGHSQKQPKAAGWHYLILKSNIAAISV